MFIDLPAAIRVEQRAARGQLGEQGNGQHAADDSVTSTHKDLLEKVAQLYKGWMMFSRHQTMLRARVFGRRLALPSPYPRLTIN